MFVDFSDAYAIIYTRSRFTLSITRDKKNNENINRHFVKEKKKQQSGD
jgi:hypothetical protein